MLPLISRTSSLSRARGRFRRLCTIRRELGRRIATVKAIFSFLGVLYREIRDSRKIFRPEWDWWRWGIGLWLDADLDPGFDWTHLLFFIHLGPFRLTMGLEDND